MSSGQKERYLDDRQTDMKRSSAYGAGIETGINVLQKRVRCYQNVIENPATGSEVKEDAKAMIRFLQSVIIEIRIDSVDM